MATNPEAYLQELEAQREKAKQTEGLSAVEQVQAMSEKERQEVWRQTIELDLVASFKTQEMINKELENLRVLAGSRETYTDKVRDRFAVLNRASEELAQHIEIFKHVAQLYDEKAWEDAEYQARREQAEKQ